MGAKWTGAAPAQPALTAGADGGRTREHEDAGADYRTDAERREIEWTERASEQTAFRFGLQIGERLAGEQRGREGHDTPGEQRRDDAPALPEMPTGAAHAGCVK